MRLGAGVERERYGRWRAGVLATALAFALCACTKASSPSAARPEEVSVQTADGVRLAATVYRPGKERPPGLILMHALGADRHAWAPFAIRASRAGYLCVAFDMRGHGQSTARGGQTISYRTFAAKDWEAVRNDVGAAKRLLLEHGAHPANLALMGASLGANLALHYALQDPDVQALVMVSPGLDYRGVKTKSEISAYGKRPVLLVASEGDSYSASSSEVLKNTAEGFRELRVYPGAMHGTDILDVSMTAAEQVFVWLSPIIGPRTPGV